jgi:DNA-binding MarR family transcriptional regulator
MVFEINKFATGKSACMGTAEIARHLGVATSSITRAIEKMVEGTG